jgi:hypothetical protein
MLFRQEVFGKKYAVLDLLGNRVAHITRDWTSITLYVVGNRYNDIPLESRNLDLFIQNCLIDKKDFLYGPEGYEDNKIQRGYYVTVRENDILVETNGCIKGNEDGSRNFSVAITNDQLPCVIELVKRVADDKQFGAIKCE